MNQQNYEIEIQHSTDLIDRKWIDVNIPCKAACPIMTDIPGYIGAIMAGDYERAYAINRMDNVLPGVLGRVCHRPCEKACRHGWDGLGDPVSICFLKRSAADFGRQPVPSDIVKNGKRVCVVGAGPSGLTAANDLALRGYQVTVLEQFDQPGGMLRYGIPQFRLPYEIVADDVKSITDLGVEIRTNTRIQTVADFEQLRDQYDAVILAGGCMLPNTIAIDGAGASGFYWGLDFMMMSNREQFHHPLEKVVVVGGGFTAVDCTRMAYRLGARKITIAFRRTKDDMSAGAHELVAMEAEGIDFSFLVSPVDVVLENGRVAGLRLIRTAIQPDGKLAEIPGSEFVMEADTVILAIGQKEEKQLLESDPEKYPNFFTAGDFRRGASTVIEAAADGRKTAREVHRKLSGISVYQDVVHIEEVKDTGRKRDFDFIARQPMDEIPVNERREKNREVETGFSQEKSLVEARRCYLCHYNFQIDIARCIYCLACIDVMPVDCIKMAKDIIIHDDGSLTYVETKKWSEVQAITIDNDKCIRCGNCYRACPVDCISISKYSLEVVEKR
ncbi:MAG: FAD-dependent oxidoreductase [Candidatus Zhuqueibacterota bacterium]